MLTERELATIRAALTFWREEMHPHDDEEMLHPYFDASPVDPLTSAEIEELRALLQPERVRYAAFDRRTAAIQGDQLFASPEAALQAAGPDAPLAVVLLPH
jgi:hypothetical protein